MASSYSLEEVESIAFSDIRVTQRTAPLFTLDGREVDIWSPEYTKYHSRTVTDQIRESIKTREASGQDVFPDVVGKQEEKELAKRALFSGSPILFRGDRGFGKTTFSKAITQLLEPKMLAIAGCKIHDDPTRPACFACKWKISHQEKVELVWTPRIWIRIPGDPMLTTRQLIGGVSIQKLREGFDLDHPEVFVPGRALKANRGIGYFDELGAIPSSLQTMLHELLEEHQITTSEGDLVPMKIDSLEIASTNPSNYRGTSAIKEPLTDRMEIIDFGPPETVEEEIEIAMRNMFYFKNFGKPAPIPIWHQRLMAQIVRTGRDGVRGKVRLAAGLSCRATIKLFDHVYSSTERRGGRVPLLLDYGRSFDAVRLALNGRIELEHGTRISKDDLITMMVAEAMKQECKWIYDNFLPSELFDALISELHDMGYDGKSESLIRIQPSTLELLRGHSVLNRILNKMCPGSEPEFLLSALEAILSSLATCSDYVSLSDGGYVVKEVARNAEASV
ncbi:MAG: ATPase [Thermoprotei archaeon]